MELRGTNTCDKLNYQHGMMKPEQLFFETTMRY